MYVAVAALAVRVLVVTTDASPESTGLTEALGIQLSDIGAVEAGGALEAGALPEKIEAAAELVDARGATLAVWVERGRAGAGEYVLYVVGERRGRVLVEVFHVSARPGPDLDRALALKVREVLDTLLAEPDEPPVTVAEWVVETPPPPIVIQPPPPPPPQRAWLVEGGLRGYALGDAVNPQLGLWLGGGVRLPVDRLRIDVTAGAGGVTGVSEVDDAGEIDTNELVVGLGASAHVPAGSLRVGGRFELTGRFVAAAGKTPLGAEDTDWVEIPGVAALAEARWRYLGAELRAGLGLDIALRPRRLAVNQQVIVDLGRWRPVLELSVVFPLR